MKVPIVQESLVCVSPTATMTLSCIKGIHQLLRRSKLASLHEAAPSEGDLVSVKDRPFSYGCVRTVEPECLLGEDGKLVVTGASAVAAFEFPGTPGILETMAVDSSLRATEAVDCEILLSERSDLLLSDPIVSEIGVLLTRRSAYVVLPRGASMERVAKFSHRLVADTFREGVAGVNGMEAFHVLEAWATGAWNGTYQVSKACRLTAEAPPGDLESVCAAMAVVTLCYNFCGPGKCRIMTEVTHKSAGGVMEPPRNIGPFLVLGSGIS